MPTRSGSDMVRRAAQPQRSQLGLAMQYPVAGDSRVARRVEFQRLMQGIALRLAPYAVTAAQQQTLADVKKGRYQFAALSTLLDVAAQSHEPFMLEDAVRGEVQRRMLTPKPLGVHDAQIAEAKEQGEADVAVATWQRDRTPQAAQRAEAELRDHARAATVAADTLAGVR